MNNTFSSVLIVLSLNAVVATAPAQDFFGLGLAGDRLLRFDQGGAVSRDLPISGLSSGDSLVDIDVFFSGDGRLYGLGTSGTLYTLNPDSGAATVNVLDAAVGSPIGIDFNPAADRLRIFSGDQNFRLTPTTGLVSADGALTYAPLDVNAGVSPNLGAAAYINNVDGPGSTALYSIDTELNTLVLHSGGPQFSTLNTVSQLMLDGSLFDVGSDVGFDVFSPLDGLNFAFLSDGNSLYGLNLVNGQLSALSFVDGGVDIRSIAVAVPEASTLWTGAGLLALVWTAYRLRNRVRE